MTPERYAELDRSGKGLTRAEQRLGWHFCPDFDQMLTEGEQVDSEGRCAFCRNDPRRFEDA